MKLHKYMTNEELENEIRYWDQKIENATGWGAALGEANEFRKEAQRELDRRAHQDKRKSPSN